MRPAVLRGRTHTAVPRSEFRLHTLVGTDWFNTVDATYRADLRELIELNFARSDAKLEQRLAELDAKWERRIAELRIDTVREIGEVKSGLIQRMFAFWAPTALAVIGTGAGVISLLLRR